MATKFFNIKNESVKTTELVPVYEASKLIEMSVGTNPTTFH